MNLDKIADTVAKMVHDDKTDVGDVEVVEPIGEGVHKDRSTKMMSSEMTSIASEIIGITTKENVMDKQKIARELLEAAKELVAAETFKCPDCGSKVLEQTKYCVKCKKKVKKASELVSARPEREQVGYVAGIKYHGNEQLMDTRGGIMVGYGRKTKVFKTERRAWNALKKSEYADDPTVFVRPYYRVNLARIAAADFPYATLVFKKKWVEFKVLMEQDERPRTGSQPYGRNAVKAIEKVFSVLKVAGVPEENIEVIG